MHQKREALDDNGQGVADAQNGSRNWEAASTMGLKELGYNKENGRWAFNGYLIKNIDEWVEEIQNYDKRIQQALDAGLYGKAEALRNHRGGSFRYVFENGKSGTIAEMSARFCETICANPNVGYGQNDRNTLRAEILKIGFANAQYLAVPCNTDCSAFMALCAESAGVPIRYYDMGGGVMNAQTTHTMKADFPATGMYELITDSKYLTQDTYLMRGDILVSGGHTVMVLEDGALAEGREGELDMTKEELMSAKGTGDNPSPWAKEATDWAKEHKVFNGDGAGNYGWQNPITREAVAQILYNFAQAIGMA